MRLRLWLQHNCNEAHIYCRLKNWGWTRESAKRWGRIVGRLLKPFAYGWGK